MTAPIKLLGIVAVASLAFGAGPAWADFFVEGTATKTKTVTVDKTVTIYKDVTINVDSEVKTDSTSEQDIFANQRNQFNYVEDEASRLKNEITDAYKNASGEQATIQNNGMNNNNLNSDSLSYATSPGNDNKGVFIDAEVNIEQINGLTEDPPCQGAQCVELPDDQDGRGINVFQSLTGGNYSNEIDGSFNKAAGVAKTIQENGSNNNNFNGVAIALGDFGVFALDEVNAGQFNNFNFAQTRALKRTNTINDSFNNYDGITATIQNNGSNTNNANVSAIAASTQKAPTPGAKPVGGL
jgi:hypothetical protein